MAAIVNNLLIKGVSGTFGKTIVFKQWRNKTIIANYSPPTKKQSEAQKANRSKFRKAATWAHTVLQDPVQKNYYQEKAKELGLPNAYTAAITDYMRSATVHKAGEVRDGISYNVSKKDFSISKAEVQVRDEAGTLVETKSTAAMSNGDYIFELPNYPATYSLIWYVTDAANNVNAITLRL